MGLRQGDLLSPFLFIIAAKALHVTIEEAKAKRLFEGVKVEDNSVDLSYLQFADDALLLGKWSLDNARKYGFRFERSNMNKTCNWKPIIEKFRKRLTAWKARSLSYGGRLTLIKSVLGAVVVVALLLGIQLSLETYCNFYPCGVPIRWNKNRPIKINIHSWRLSLNCLPTRFNLDRRGIDLNSVRCLVCDGDIETDLHVFVKCLIAISIWNSISRWWNTSDFPKDINGLIKWSDTLTLNKHTKICLDVVIQTSLWILWRYRNRICFDLKPTRKDTLMEEIMILSHSWILNGNRSLHPSWLEWISDPKIACIITL
ncbi:reverse transcriptase domain, reverse transcriptase zinc-binding domain protein [Tanacetum coccineum]|uniref:Reverse transcriptase domain, reverse transcriptase zinc-binding domain protein n=1 Tax=Tanacetum coccineum TaxID=301880 RepID=A0ABQ5J7X6_9ASTR